MRSRLLLILAFSTLVATGFSCHEAELPIRDLRGYFWTTDAPGVIHRMYIDKQYKGILPHLASPVNDSMAVAQGLNIPLETGTHEVIVSDNNETVISKGEIKLKFTEGDTKIGFSWNNHRCMGKVVYE